MMRKNIDYPILLITHDNRKKNGRKEKALSRGFSDVNGMDLTKESRGKAVCLRFSHCETIALHHYLGKHEQDKEVGSSTVSCYV